MYTTENPSDAFEIIIAISLVDIFGSGQGIPSPRHSRSSQVDNSSEENPVFLETSYSFLSGKCV